MSIWVAPLFKKVATIAFVAFFWVVAFEVNILVFFHFEYSNVTHWVFLPAALRIIFVLLFGWIGAVGLMLGAFLTISEAHKYSEFHFVLLAISSGIAPIAAIHVSRIYLYFAEDLSGLKGQHIVVLSTVCAILNGVILSIYTSFQANSAVDLRQIMVVFIGDMIGTMIVLFCISSLSFLALNINYRSRH